MTLVEDLRTSETRVALIGSVFRRPGEQCSKKEVYRGEAVLRQLISGPDSPNVGPRKTHRATVHRELGGLTWTPETGKLLNFHCC